MRTTKRIFEASALSCTRGGRVLFQNLSLHFSEGDVLHLSGPNGAGKTSLLRILAGALPPSTGRLTWEGKNYMKDGLAIHARRFSFLPADDRGLKTAETAEENLSFWAALAGAESARVRQALEKMDIANLATTPVRHLSAGQRRRLSLARVFLKDAPLWLLDEPLNGLDMQSYDLFVDALDEHTAKGGMAAIASHYAIAPPKSGELRRVDVGVLK